MRFWSAAAIWLVLCAFSVGPSVYNLGWMSGDWLSETKDGWTEESWTDARAEVMLGAGRSGRGDELRDWEFMRIARGEHGFPVFWGSPKGGVAVAFPMVTEGARMVVFENRKHDYPQRIAYRREGKMLIATISAADGTRTVTWRYRRVGR